MIRLTTLKFALCVTLALAVLPAICLGKGKTELSPIDIYIREAATSDSAYALTAGSLYTKAGILSDLSRDLQARQVNDIVTIVVADSASAVSRGVTNTGRKSSAKASVSSLFGTLPEASGLANLAELGGSRALQGQGETSRETTLTTTISARVTHVLPNGYLVVEGEKQILVNSERQQVTIRGVVRWNDIGSANEVASNRLANLEVRVNGKGVVGDAIKRPNILYRVLLGILPF
jgi:flagellar L-ring protein FlgH